MQAVAQGIRARLETVPALRAVYDHAPARLTELPAAVVLLPLLALIHWLQGNLSISTACSFCHL